jgi:hypothetical protein
MTHDANRRNTRSMQRNIPVPETVLANLLGRAAAVARFVGHIDAIAVGPLADDIDAIVHELSELHGNHHLNAAPALTPTAEDGTRDDPATGAIGGGR